MPFTGNIDVAIILGGMISGLASTGTYEAMKSLKKRERGGIVC